MSGKLQAEIGKRGPFASLAEEVALNLLRTGDRLIGYFETVLKPAGLNGSQYNVLRILRGEFPKGIACQEIARRMIVRDADLTRLLDRLEKRGLLRRERQTDDRRVVHILIAPAGLELLARLDAPILEMNRFAFSGLATEWLINCISGLEHIRQNVEIAKNTLETPRP